MVSVLPESLAGLLRAEAYPHAVRGLRVVETHISWVILTGDFAYKIKRPVRLPFVDFSSLALREFYCREELRLNARFAPDLYLDVQQIVRRNGRAVLGGEGELLDYAVRMRQFEPVDELTALLETNRVSADEIATFAAEFAAVQENLRRWPSQAEPARIRHLLLENAQQCIEVAADGDTRESIRRCQWLLHAALDRLASTIAARDAGGYVREGHGDLHASNMARVGGRLQAFDCLEFEPEFRRIDVAHEIAFLTMDLDALGHPVSGTVFLNAWLAATGDYGACELLDLYEAHCALVRAKVAGISAPNVHAPERLVLTARQRALVQLAERRLTRRQPVMVLMHGVSGSGKSWLARRLALELPAIWVRSDVERKRLASLDALASSHSALGAGIYGREQGEHTYRALADEARAILRGDRIAVVDAANLARSQRAQFVAVATELCVPIVLISCHAAVDVLRARIDARRRARNDPSEATQEVLDSQLRALEQPDEAEGFKIVDAAACDAPTVARAVREHCR